MELKYYLRGLGVGIAVAAIIMGIALSGDQTMTDTEIIARAKELGMVENTVLAEDDAEAEDAAPAEEEEPGDAEDAKAEDTAPAKSEEPENVEDAEAEDTTPAAKSEELQTAENAETGDTAPAKSEELQTAEKEESEDAENEPAQTKPDEAEDTAQTGISAPEAEEELSSKTFKTIIIVSGDGSYTVAKKLQDVGVISSAETFDDFLCEHGYDKRLRTGTFSIPADAGDEQIARIVTGQE